MKTLVRVLISCVALLATFYFVFWVPCSLVPLFRELRWLAVVVSLLCAAGVVGFVCVRSGCIQRSSVGACVGLGAAVVGGSAFCLGFFGPMLLTPEANQGPCLGFMIGPLGAVLGALGGLAWARSARPDGSGTVRAGTENDRG